MKNISFLSENFQFFEMKCSIYLNRGVFLMLTSGVKMDFEITRVDCIFFTFIMLQ